MLLHYYILPMAKKIDACNECPMYSLNGMISWCGRLNKEVTPGSQTIQAKECPLVYVEGRVEN